MSDAELTRLTVNLTPAARRSLEDAARRTGDSRTDVVNIAIMLYGQIAEMAEHEGVYRVTADDFGGRPLYMRISRQPWRRWLPW